MKTSRLALPALLSLCLATAPAVLAQDTPASDSKAATSTAAPKANGSGLTPAGGEGTGPRLDPGEVAADALVVRPLGLAATAVGAAVFVVALPFAAIARDVKGTGDILVGTPARFTFVRKLGDFDSHH